jgi:GPH family glycoside/pentoside/hexuronide:cation symporter
MCAGSIFPLLWSMYADISDYSEWKTGRRATGLIFSSSSMSQKFGWTLGGALTGWLLGYYGFKANVVQTGEVQNGIRLMLSIFPAIGTVLSVIFISIYPLNEKTMAKVSLELNEKRLHTQAG